MASVSIVEKSKKRLNKLKTIDYGIIDVKRRGWSTVLVEEDINFRVRFTNIGVEAYGRNNVPGIGIQVIGFSNYIL